MICKDTVKTYCCEDISLIENYEKAINDKTQTWDCHHRLEINNGQLVSGERLKQLGLYYKRPASELIFLTSYEHHSLHSSNLSEETRLKRSQSLSGSGNGNFGRNFSKEHKEKLSKSHTGKKPWNAGKKLDSNKMKWFNNGIENVRCEICPKGYIPGRINYKVSKDKLSKVTKDTRWYNNGVKNIRAKECPAGFVLGRLYFENKRNTGNKWFNNSIVNVCTKECPDGFVPGRIKKLNI